MVLHSGQGVGSPKLYCNLGFELSSHYFHARAAILALSGSHKPPQGAELSLIRRLDRYVLAPGSHNYGFQSTRSSQEERV
jgi:hypothetical protein